MHFDPRAAMVELAATLQSRRRSGRLPQEMLHSNLGLVADLSAGGMRVLGSASLRRRVKVELGGHKLPEPLNGTIVWKRRLGLFSRELGVSFENVSDAMARALTDIASAYRFKRAI